MVKEEKRAKVDVRLVLLLMGELVGRVSILILRRVY